MGRFVHRFIKSSLARGRVVRGAPVRRVQVGPRDSDDFMFKVLLWPC